MGKELSDLEINFAQVLLKHYHCKFNGFWSTLSQEKRTTLTENFLVNNIQITQCRGRHHWITVTTVNSKSEEVKVFDSAFSYCDKETVKVIHNLFCTSTSNKLILTMSHCPKQKGEKDCGLFSIAFTIAIVFGLHLGKLKFDQDMMQTPLVNCFLKEHLTYLPTPVMVVDVSLTVVKLLW